MAEAEPHDAARDIFGSESEGDSDAFPTQPADVEEEIEAPQQISQDSDQPEERQASGEDEDLAQQDQAGFSQRVEEPQGPPLEIEAPLLPNPDAAKLRFFKASNVLGIDSRPYDARLLLENAWEDQEGRQHVELRHLNTIRWRWVAQEDGSLAVQSNARWVRWEDGSVQLFVGSEVLNGSDTDITSNHQHLYVRHKDLIQGQAPLDNRLTVQPASLSAAFHKRLTATADRKHAKQMRVRHTTTVANPLKERAAREKQEEERIRSRENLERKQAQKMRGYAQPRRPPQSHGLTSKYLEEEADEGEYDDEGEDEGEADARASLSRGRYDEDLEREREERLASAKRTTPSTSEPRGKRLTSTSGDPEPDDFIADEEDEEDELKRSKAKRQKRAVVLSDSDED